VFRKNVFRINLVPFRIIKSEMIGCKEKFDRVQEETGKTKGFGLTFKVCGDISHCYQAGKKRRKNSCLELRSCHLCVCVFFFKK